MNKNCENVMHVIGEIICLLNVCNIPLVIHCDATPNIDTRFLRLHQLLPPYKVRMVIFIPFPDYVTFLFRLLMYV